MQDYITPFIYLLVEMAPYLLLGFLIAGILHSFVPQKVYRKWLSGNDLKSVLLSIAFGVPLPLCSCGVIPTAVSMRKEGASKGATTAFLIATPQTGVDSIAATWSVLGLPFAIMRPIVAMVTALFGGLAANKIASEEEGSDVETSCDDGCCSVPDKMSFWGKCKEALKYGFDDMIQDIGRWLVIGLVIAGLITIFVPNDFFVSYSSNHLVNMLLVLVISIPMYVCATGSIPIAAALMLKGLSPGAALVLLMAGPATNMASIIILGKTLGKKSLIVYLTSIIIGAMGFGLLIDGFLPQEWFTSSIKTTFQASCCHSTEMPATETPWWKVASTIILSYLLIRALVKRLRTGRSEDRVKTGNSENTNNNTVMNTYLVKGMVCNHCKANVQNHLAELEGVKNVNVDLATGLVDVEGDIAPEKVISTVTDLGYECSKR
ncbi:MAG: SO_0444 family Cu/Zn efflux transporter [Bacteroidales bacterium]|nr:SO_0444 family Cu/Zn efflux transporter [Bacteroidales bacterium]